MAGRNFILLLRNIIFSKNMVTWKSIRDLRLPWKLSHVNRNLSTKFSLVTTSDFMVGFSSVVDCQRSLKVIIMKLLIALKIIFFFANFLNVFVFWSCFHFFKISVVSTLLPDFCWETCQKRRFQEKRSGTDKSPWDLQPSHWKGFS